jgi:hypothetical protein
MYKIKNSDIPFVTISKENMFTICNSLEYDEIGIIFKAFMDFVYFGIEPTFEKKYMRGIFDGVLQTMERKAEGCFASRENGKKGGRKPKNNTELQPNTDFEKEAKNSPNEAIKPQNDIVIPQEDESVSEGPKQGEFDDIIDTFESNIKEDEYMENYSNIAVAECRAEVQEFNSERVMGWLEQNYPYLLSRMNNLPSKALTIDENMKRMRESLHGTMKDIFKNNETLINSIYIYIINNKLKQ